MEKGCSVHTPENDYGSQSRSALRTVSTKASIETDEIFYAVRSTFLMMFFITEDRSLGTISHLYRPTFTPPLPFLEGSPQYHMNRYRPTSPL